MTAVSVIIPVYNAAPYVKRAIDSALDQGSLPMEIIVVNDGSSDGSGVILDDYARRYENVRVIHQSNRGVSAARNAGLDLARGEYLFFADADDWLEPDSLRALYESGLEHNADVVMSDFVQELPSGEVKKHLFEHAFCTDSKDVIEVLQRSVVYCQATKFTSEVFDRVLSFGGACWHHLIKRSLLQENRIEFDSALDGMLEDGYLLLQVFEEARCIVYDKTTLYHYRVNDGSATHRLLPDYQERFGRALDYLTAYGASHGKGDEYTQALYMRQVYFINKACDVYFGHPANTAGLPDRYQEFCEYLETDRVKEALAKVDISLFGSRNAQIQAFLLKRHLWRIYFLLKTRKAKKR